MDSPPATIVSEYFYRASIGALSDRPAGKVRFKTVLNIEDLYDDAIPWPVVLLPLDIDSSGEDVPFVPPSNLQPRSLPPTVRSACRCRRRHRECPQRTSRRFRKVSWTAWSCCRLRRPANWHRRHPPCASHLGARRRSRPSRRIRARPPNVDLLKMSLRDYKKALAASRKNSSGGERTAPMTGYEMYRLSLLKQLAGAEYADASSDDLSSDWEEPDDGRKAKKVHVPPSFKDARSSGHC
ncbi:hypothetical protein MRX96_006403 [Rhipicephalus microplus]